MAADTLVSFENLQRVLQEYGEMLTTRYREDLIRAGHYASGDLEDTLEYIIDQDGREISVSLKLQDYWKYLESGTKPHWVPINALLEWVKVKPVLPDGRFKGRLPENATLDEQQKSIAYAVQHKIAYEGTPSDPVLHWTLQEVNAYYAEAIGIAIEQDLSGVMTSILSTFNTF